MIKITSAFIATTCCQYLKTKKWYTTGRIKTNLGKILKDFSLEIVAPCKLRILNYLGVTLNLNHGSIKPYDKPDDIIQYIHKEPNHPPISIEQLPAFIEKRLS